MGDEWLIDIVESWDELGWIDRKRIWWKCYKYKHGITWKQVISLAALMVTLVMLIREQHPRHIPGLLAIIALVYFYTLFINYLVNRGKVAR